MRDYFNDTYCLERDFLGGKTTCYILYGDFPLACVISG